MPARFRAGRRCRVQRGLAASRGGAALGEAGKAESRLAHPSRTDVPCAVAAGEPQHRNNRPAARTTPRLATATLAVVLRFDCARDPRGMGVVAVLRFTTESARMFTGADRGLDCSPQHDPLAGRRGQWRRESRDSAILSIRPRVAKWDRRSPGAARRGFLYGGGSVSTRIGFCSPTRPAPHRPSASSICGARRMAQWTKVAGPKPPGAMA